MRSCSPRAQKAKRPRCSRLPGIMNPSMAQRDMKDMAVSMMPASMPPPMMTIKDLRRLAAKERMVRQVLGLIF